MSVLTALRTLFSTREASVARAGHAQGGPGAAAQPPFAGYERLDSKHVIAALPRHSQIELDAVEAYERSHQSRQPVLDKLSYMRGPEPLPRYDALSPEEIVTALEQVDVKTIKRVRTYERKFANRPDLLEAVVRARDRRRETEPVSAAPAYRAMSDTRASA